VAASPLYGIGVAPTGNLAIELNSITRRAFVPSLFVQIYFSSPNLFYLIGNARKAAGGFNQITVPVQGQSMVQGSYTNYGGSFMQPQVIPAIQNAQFNLAYWTVGIPLPFGETIIQSTETVIPLLKARMNDAYAVTWQNMAQQMYLSASTTNVMFPDSFINAFDSGTNFPTYGGINRTVTGNTFFQSQYINLGAAPWSLTTGFTRATMSNFLTKITDGAGGEAPTYVVMNPADWSTLNKDFIGIEQTFKNPGQTYTMDTPMNSSWPNLNVNNIPIFADHFCPVGQVFAVNMKYASFHLSEDAAFDFSGFYSLVPLNQMAQQGVVVCGYNFVCAKPVSCAQGFGLGGNAF
jgi:hypothetical protein